MDGLTIRSASFVSDHDEIYRIRDIVYMQGQDCPYAEEFDGFDEKSEHFLAYMGEVVVGYCRLRMVGEKAKLERFTVYEEWRSRGVGVALVEFLLQRVRAKAVVDIYLHAQTRVQGFYEKLGFKARGETFPEAGIEHIVMYFQAPLS